MLVKTEGKMKKQKWFSAIYKVACLALVAVLLFSAAQICIAEFDEYASVAIAKSTKNKKQFNDLTSGSNELYLPNYDTEVITKTFNKPNVTTFGDHEASYYPSYTNQITDFNDAKKATILAENQKILADTKAWFANGTLQYNLKKHVSADGQFSNANGNYDDAPRIEKVVTVNSKITARKRSLGVFAPAGEVITITIDESLVGKLTVNIGYPYEGECEIYSGNFDRWHNDRMAQFYLEFKLTEAVTYIGSPLGGMITLNSVDSSLGNFDITISGGVNMPDYKLGVSTKEDWQNILAAPGPYVWLLTPYQYFVMPKVEISDIEDPYNAMLWWHKASMISMYSMAREDTNHFYTPVISIYDSYVYIGEGVAKVWAFVTNAPKYWCHGMLDYDNLMSSGAWGAIHEYNHHHQSHAYNSAEWGVGGHDEVTNNVINAISYILLTDIAATRSETNVLNNWGAVTDPYCNYRRFYNASNNNTTYEGFDTNKLFGYVDLMHSFGAEKFMQYLRAMYGYGEVEGYDGASLNESGYLTTQDGFTLFTSLFYKTDFVDYFTKVWHFNISNETVQKIKSYGFDEYVTINNLYSVGLQGVETGRAYKINAGTTTVLKLDEFTLSSAESYKLEKVTKPKHGKLTDNKDGTYSYTPNKNFSEDSFNLVYKVTLNGKTYTKTLVVKLTANYNYVERVTYNGDNTQRGLSVEEAIAQYEKDDNILSKGTVNNFTATVANGDNLTHFRAAVAFPFTNKKVTFMVYGDDKAYLKIGDSTAFTASNIGNIDVAKECETNKITVSVKAGKPLQIDAYCFNTGGAGSLQLKYSVDGGETYQDIPASYCYAYSASKKDVSMASQSETNVYTAPVDFRNKYMNKWYSNSISFTVAEAKCLDDDGNEVRTVNGADINAMFDGNTSTGFHTAWQGTKTAYPHNYYITFAEEAYFNRINFFFGNNGTKGYYSFGEYEIYASSDGVTYNLIKEGKNEETHFNVQFDTAISAKYVKIVVKSNAAGLAFTNVTEIQFVQSLDLGEEYNVYNADNTSLKYVRKSKWSMVYGNYLNSNAMRAQKGKIRFSLRGTDLMLYSTNAQSTIKIDGKTYTIKANSSEYSPSFIISGLSNRRHRVEIQGNDMALDMIKTTGTISRDNSAGTAVGVTFAVVTVVGGAGLACADIFIFQKRKKNA